MQSSGGDCKWLDIPGGKLGPGGQCWGRQKERTGSRAPQEADSVALALDRIGEEKEDGIAKGSVSQTSVSCSWLDGGITC